MLPLASPPPPTVTARAAVLMDAADGRLLFAKAPHQPLPPASTTKVLTALVALEHLNLNEKITVSRRAADTEPSRIGLHSGETLYIHDLLYGLLLKSGNDAAEAIAEAVADSVPGFARLMNAKAAEIGAHHSQFLNPHGLHHDGHYSTAYDIALIFRYGMQNPVFADIVRTRQAALRIESGYPPAHWRMITVRNSNKMLTSYNGAMGGKTGYTSKAKRCFVGEAERGAVRLIVAVLGSKDRWEDITALLDYGFTVYGVGRSPASPLMTANYLPKKMAAITSPVATIP